MIDGLQTIATEEDIRRAAETMERAFVADPLIPYLLPDPVGRVEKALVYYAANLRHAVLFGEAYATPGFEGAIAWLLPRQENWSYDKLKQSGMAQSAENFGEEAWLRFRQLISLPMPPAPTPHWYLLLLGVEPAHQRQGLGRQLLAPLLAKADAAGDTVRLETNNAESIPFYERQGFKVVYTGQVNASMPQWALERTAVSRK